MEKKRRKGKNRGERGKNKGGTNRETKRVGNKIKRGKKKRDYRRKGKKSEVKGYGISSLKKRDTNLAMSFVEEYIDPVRNH